METTSNGAFFQVGSTGLRFADITDGLSHTLLVGEKHVNLGQFGTGWLDSSIYNGQYFAPTGRAAGGHSSARNSSINQPRRSVHRASGRQTTPAMTPV